MKVYRSAILLAILILATPGAYLFDASQTWGWPKPGDIRETSEVVRLAKFFSYQRYNATLRMPTKMNCVKFWDKKPSGATVWMSKEPPCYESVVTITSRFSHGFHFVLEVFRER